MSDWRSDTTIFSIRHGRSEAQDSHALHRMMGDAKIPLSKPKGFEQAEECGDFLHEFFAEHPPEGGVLVISTPYLRGRQTLETFLPRIRSIENPEIAFESYLGEQCFGGASGLTIPQIRERYPDFRKARDAAIIKKELHSLPFPDVDIDGRKGESQDDVHLRTAQILSNIEAAYARGVKTIIINSHGTSGRAAQMNILGIKSSDEAWGSWHRPNNCQVDLIKNGKYDGVVYAGGADVARSSRMIVPKILASSPGYGTA